jgi:regulatory protein YycI of two-component signal transduction system YycFG
MSLNADTRFEICAGKKVHMPRLRQFRAQTTQNGSSYDFTEIVQQSKITDQVMENNWILGGQDSCHVGGT